MIAAVQHRHPASDKMVLQALVPFKLLYERAIFTQKSVAGLEKEKIDSEIIEQNTQYYQRKLNQTRVKEIQKFIVDTILDEKDNNEVATLFPSSMILAVSKEVIEQESDTFELEFDDAPIYIVDGQHRMMAMKLLYERMSRREYIQDEDVQYIRSYLENYRFNATILVNYDLWEQGQVFVNVNFRQKPVNKSLYYEVFGAEYSENPNDRKRNHIYVAHRITEWLNNYEESAFYKQVKMLGTGKGYVSQAFFVEAILPQFRSQGVWYRKVYELEEKQNIVESLSSELISYFVAIKEMFKSNWGVREKGGISHICKTTGVGAFMRLFPLIHQNVGSEILKEIDEENSVSLNKAYIEATKKILKPLESHNDRLFGEESQYSKTGGKGFEAALYKDMLKIIASSDVVSNLTFQQSQQRFVEEMVRNRTISLEERLKQIGIRDIRLDIERYMNANMPSEVDCIGSHVRVENVTDISYLRLEKTSDKTYVLTGGFDCEVSDWIDSEDDRRFTMIFPASFSLLYRENNGKWELSESGSKVSVNTDSFYR